MGENDEVALHDLPEFPTGQDVGDAAILLHATHDDLGNQFAVAINQQLATFQNALVFTDTKHHEVPLRIRHQYLALQAGRQRYEEGRISIDQELSIEFIDFPCQNLVLSIRHCQII